MKIEYSPKKMRKVTMVTKINFMAVFGLWWSTLKWDLQIFSEKRNMKTEG